MIKKIFAKAKLLSIALTRDWYVTPESSGQANYGYDNLRNDLNETRLPRTPQEFTPYGSGRFNSSEVSNR